jgi:hypothetical protein
VDAPEKMRIVSMPERRWACCCAVPGGLGVVGREPGIGVTDRERAFSLRSLASVGWMRGDRGIGKAREWGRTEYEWRFQIAKENGTYFSMSPVSKTFLRCCMGDGVGGEGRG